MINLANVNFIKTNPEKTNYKITVLRSLAFHYGKSLTKQTIYRNKYLKHKVKEFFERKRKRFSKKNKCKQD